MSRLLSHSILLLTAIAMQLVYASNAFAQVENTIHIDSAASPMDTNSTEGAKVYTMVEIQPKFRGGMIGLYAHLRDHMKYPEQAQQNGIEGVIYVQFIVNEDGTVSDVEILRGVDSLLNREAIRVISEMPPWEPGYQAGKPVKVYYKLPIRFALQSPNEEEKRKRKRRKD